MSVQTTRCRAMVLNGASTNQTTMTMTTTTTTSRYTGRWPFKFDKHFGQFYILFTLSTVNGNYSGNYPRTAMHTLPLPILLYTARIFKRFERVDLTRHRHAANLNSCGVFWTYFCSVDSFRNGVLAYNCELWPLTDCDERKTKGSWRVLSLCKCVGINAPACLD